MKETGFVAMIERLIFANRKIVMGLFAVIAKVAGNFSLTGYTVDDLAAISPGRAPANPVGFDHVNLVSTFSQVQGS